MVRSRSFWLSQALEFEPNWADVQPLVGTLQADVCIVGGGYTGLWTAIELKQRHPSMTVAVLESSACGSGASGTNAGILMNLWPKLRALQRIAGRDEAVRMARESSAAIEHIIGFCADHGIEAGIRRSGWLWASTNARQDGAWEDTVLSAAELIDSPFRVLATAEASELAGTGVRGGVLDPTCAVLQPAVLARGLARTARELGVTVFEFTPMTGLSGGSRPVVRTALGSVTADSVVLAINAWASRFSVVRRHLVMTASDNVVTAPVGALAPAAVSDSGRLLDYWRPLPDGSMLFGKAGVGLGFHRRAATSLFGPPPRPGQLTEHLTRSIPRLSGVPVVSAWRAPVEYSTSSLPFFGALPGYQNVYFGTGYSGDGIGPSVVGSKILASLATRVADQHSASPLVGFPKASLPPEPVRFLGGQLVKRALLREDRLHDLGRKADPVTSRLAAIDPTSFVG